jgi:hypothetical protein
MEERRLSQDEREVVTGYLTREKRCFAVDQQVWFDRRDDDPVERDDRPNPKQEQTTGVDDPFQQTPTGSTHD